jgi:hypothetical protein
MFSQKKENAERIQDIRSIIAAENQARAKLKHQQVLIANSKKSEILENRRRAGEAHITKDSYQNLLFDEKKRELQHENSLRAEVKNLLSVTNISKQKSLHMLEVRVRREQSDEAERQRKIQQQILSAERKKMATPPRSPGTTIRTGSTPRWGSGSMSSHSSTPGRSQRSTESSRSRHSDSSEEENSGEEEKEENEQEEEEVN